MTIENSSAAFESALERALRGDHLVVVAVNEPLKPRQVLRVDLRRYVVVQELTEDQFARARKCNYQFRERARIPHPDCQFYSEGEGPMSLTKTSQHPTEPPETCKLFYWVKEL